MTPEDPRTPTADRPQDPLTHAATAATRTPLLPPPEETKPNFAALLPPPEETNRHLLDLSAAGTSSAFVVRDSGVSAVDRKLPTVVSDDSRGPPLHRCDRRFTAVIPPTTTPAAGPR